MHLRILEAKEHSAAPKASGDAVESVSGQTGGDEVSH